MNIPFKVIILLVFPIIVFAQGNEFKINFIKKQFAEINSNIGSYKKITKQDTAQTTEGNEITAWLEGQYVKKMVALYYGETGK